MSILLRRGGLRALDCKCFMLMDHIEPGNTKRAPFVLQTNDQIELLRESKSRSLFIRVMNQLAPSFQKGTVNIVFESSSSSKFSAGEKCKTSRRWTFGQYTRQRIGHHHITWCRMFLPSGNSRGSKERATGLDDHPKCTLRTESSSSAAAKRADRTTNAPKRMLKYPSTTLCKCNRPDSKSYSERHFRGFCKSITILNIIGFDVWN